MVSSDVYVYQTLQTTGLSKTAIANDGATKYTGK